MSIEVVNLCKDYGGRRAVHDVSFSVPSGSVFAFLGENGAGKSTTIGCITTTLAPTSGVISVSGYDVEHHPHDVRASIGAVFQSSLLDPLLSVRENLAVRAGFYGLDTREAGRRIGTLSDLVGLGSFLERRYGTLSGGQKRRADIARALVHEPRVLFLDEPTAVSTLSPGRGSGRRSTSCAATAGTTVFLTTHYMERPRTPIARVHHRSGRIIAGGTPCATALSIQLQHPHRAVRGPRRGDRRVPHPGDRCPCGGVVLIS